MNNKHYLQIICWLDSRQHCDLTKESTLFHNFLKVLVSDY